MPNCMLNQVLSRVG